MLVAVGDAPVNGDDDVIEWKLDVESEDESKRAVLPGQVIATIKSKSGVDVFEVEVPGVDGNKLTLECGDGVEVTKKDGAELYLALRLGAVQFESDKLSIRSNVKISADKLTVTMSLIPPNIETGKTDILLPHVTTTLYKHGVVYGIKNDEIKQLLEIVNKEREPKLDVLVAEGRPAKDGVNARIEVTTQRK